MDHATYSVSRPDLLLLLKCLIDVYNPVLYAETCSMPVPIQLLTIMAQANSQPYSSQQLQKPSETVMCSIRTEPLISRKPIRTIHICKRELVEATQIGAVG